MTSGESEGSMLGNGAAQEARAALIGAGACRHTHTDVGGGEARSRRERVGDGMAGGDDGGPVGEVVGGGAGAEAEGPQPARRKSLRPSFEPVLISKAGRGFRLFGG